MRDLLYEEIKKRMEAELSGIRTESLQNFTTSSNSTFGDFSIDKLKEAIDLLPPMPEKKSDFYGIGFKPLRFEPETELVPVKAHNLRFNGKMSYHKRIQKKWNKRYGFKKVEKAYMFNDSMLFCPTITAKKLGIIAIDVCA